MHEKNLATGRPAVLDLIGNTPLVRLKRLVSPGSGGFNFKSFNPGNIPSGNGLYLGIVFTILALSGF
jgi:hypothetical protein